MRRIFVLAVVLGSLACLAGASSAVAGPFTSADPLPILSSPPGKNGLIVFEQQRKCGDRCAEYRTGRPGIWSYDPKNDERKLLVPGPNAQSPHFSPNGSRIVFSNELFGQTDVFVMRSDGANLRQVTNDETEEIDPAFLADGRIGYLSAEGSHYSYFSIRPDGTDRQPEGLYDQFMSAGSASSADGDVAFTSCAQISGPCHVFVKDSVTEVSTEVTFGDVIDRDATFIPGGGLISYIRTKSDSSDDCCLEPGVWIMVPNGKRNRQIYWGKPDTEITGITFSPDGNKLLVENFRPHETGPGGFGWIDVVGLDRFETKRIRASAGRGLIEDADWQTR